MIRNRSLDLLKLIASYLVVFIHISFTGVFGMAVDAVARIAVPLFFMCSGYFCYSNAPEKILKKAKRILKIFLIGYPICFLFRLVTYILESNYSDLTEYVLSYFNVKHIVNFLIFNETLTPKHFWFLPALIYCYLIYYVVVKLQVSQRKHYMVVLVLLLVHLICGEILSLLGIEIEALYIRNFLFLGYPFFVLGVLINQKQAIFIKTISNITLIALAVVGLIESVLSIYLFGQNELYMGSLFTVFALFLTALKKPIVIHNKFIDNLCSCTLYIYLFHNLINDLMEKVLSSFGYSFDNVLLKNLRPIIVCVIASLVAITINYVISKIDHKKVKRIY